MIYLDSGVIMRLVVATADLRKKYEGILGADRHVTSQVAYIECVCKPRELGLTEVVDAFDAYFTSSDVDLIDVDSTIARSAVELRARFNLKVPDAIHLATALTTRCAKFLTTDRDFERCVGVVAIEIVSFPHD